MLTNKKIIYLFKRLNEELAAKGIKGELGVVGGAAMCLAFRARASTKDVDAIFEPSGVIRALAKKIAEEEELPMDWLNDAVKGFLAPQFKRVPLLSLSHLNVWTPEAAYMLAMKCMSARFDTSDRDDVIFLLKHLKIKEPAKVFDLLESYYPKNQVSVKTKFFIEEILGAKKKRKK